MIKTNISGYLECLQTAGINHAVFIAHPLCELHLTDMDKIGQTLELLKSRSVTAESVLALDGYYLIKF